MNTSTSFTECRFEALERLGYSPRDAEFLCLAALHGGYFVRRQYEKFVSAKGSLSSGAFAKCVEHALANQHAKALVFDSTETIYHLASRPFFAALGEPDNRNRREREPSTIKRKLMGLDFVLNHPELRFLATETEKLDYFCALGVSDDVLPAKVYGQESLQPARRYFVEKYPLAVAEDSGETVFGFVDGDLTTPAHFETFLRHYGRLLMQLGRTRVVYVCDRPAPFRWSDRVFARMIRGVGRGGLNSSSNGLERYFELRRAYESGDLESLGREGLVELAHTRQRHASPELETRYDAWKREATENSSDQNKVAPVIENELLEGRYDFFGTLPNA